MKVEFPGSTGLTLAARLDLPPGTPRGYALFAHCFTCSKDSLAASRISRALTKEDVAVLRFDFTGLGGSDGEFANTDFSSNVDDVVAAAEYLAANHAAPSILIGHSLGGAAVIAAAARIPSVRAVATIAAPSAPDHVAGLFEGASAQIEREGEAEVVLAGRTFRIRREFLDDLTVQSQKDTVAKMDAALLVLHSPTDTTVGIESAREIFDAARHPKSFIALDGADHLLTRQSDASFAASMIAAWAERYAFGADAPAEVTTPDAELEQTVTVSESGDGKFGQTVLAGGHRLVADEPVPIGDNAGPSPYDYLLAALGTCTSMTVRMYADRKGIPLTGVSVILRHSRIHAEDCANCETTTGMVDHIDREILLQGELDGEQRAALLVIADKCPVHRTLVGSVDISTRELLPVPESGSGLAP